MDCEEARQKLSMAADSELPDDALAQVNRHMAECDSCRQTFENHGELDMLLKNHLSHEPPEGYVDTLWPAVSERIEQGGDGVGGGGDEEVVFKSSPAMDFLNIPERKPPPAKPAMTSEATAPEPEASPWRWPVALMVSMAIVVVGWIAYKKLSPPPPSQQPVAAVTEPAPTDEPSSMPVAAADLADAGLQVAALTTGDGGTGVETPDPTAPKSAVRHRSRKRHRRRAKGGAPSKPEPAAPGKPASAAKPKGKPKKPGKPGKPSTLDSLLDDAIGSKEVAKKKKAAAAPKAAASDLPDQLNMNQIRGTMNKVKGRVQACYDQHQVEGMANVGFIIKGSGKLNNVTIRGKFRGTDTGDCVVKAVKTARFPKFSGKQMTIKNYPFLLQ